MRLGLMLPHFGPSASRSRLIELAPRIEAYGFASAWARDHLGFRGGQRFEPRSHHIVDPFVTLSLIAATSRLTVGTCTLTPIRHPVLVAQAIGSLAYLAEGRIVLGIGLGSNQRAFDLAGADWSRRVTLCRETVEVMRALSRPGATYEGVFVRFSDLTIDPPPPADLQIWYSGMTEGAIRRTLQYATGWLAGRCPLTVFDRLHRILDERSREAGRSFQTALVPLVSFGLDRASALAKINVAELLADANGRREWTQHHRFEDAADLEGMVLAGTPEDILDGLRQFQARGITEVILDLRQRMESFDESLELIATRIIPELDPSRSSDASRREMPSTASNHQGGAFRARTRP